MFMNDINIRSVIRAYHAQSDHWRRDFFAPRIFDAVVLFTEGEIEYQFETGSFVARKGDLLFLPGNLPYSGKRHTDRVAFFVLDFTCFADNELESLHAPAVVTPEHYDLFYLKFARAVDLWNRQPRNVTLKLKSFIYLAVNELFTEDRAVQRTAPSEDILEYIVANLADPELSVGGLCRHFYISESQLRRKIVKATGLPPNEYILTLRLNRAKNELVYTNKSIREIAENCGFSTPNYFSRCFSADTGCSPGNYRRLYQ